MSASLQKMDPGPRVIQMRGKKNAAMDVARHRLAITLFLFAGAFLSLAVRTVDLGFLGGQESIVARSTMSTDVILSRADIVDRNGVVLATSLPTESLYADPKKVIDAESAAKNLALVLPDLAEADLLAKLRSARRFVWLKRKLTPAEVWRVNALGIPGVAFQREETRVYPQGALTAHVVGHVDVDGRGLGGIEHFFDDRLSDPISAQAPLALSLDLRVQHALADELGAAMTSFQAKGAAGIVLDVESGEVIALVSLPDFDPRDAAHASAEQLFNRATKGVYELGSVFKPFTFAMAFEAGAVTMEDGFDATDPIRISRFLIRDDHPKKRYLRVPEIFAYSSNIGTAKIAMKTGSETQRHFLRALGLMDPSGIELTEVGRPLLPRHWGDVTTMTVSYGHGIAVAPLQVATGIATIVNHGIHIPTTLIKQDAQAERLGTVVVSRATSSKVRQLLRLAVKRGTGSNGDVPGYRVGGKTGTAEKAGVGGYQRKALVSSFVAAFPIDAPRYVVLATLDEPKGNKATFNYAGGGWVAAPVVRNVILRTAPLLGVMPAPEDDGMYRQASLLMEE